MQRPVFVYGTLKPGEANYPRYLAGKTATEQDVHLPNAALFSPGPYPFLVVGEGIAKPYDLVGGVLATIQPEHYDAVLAELDGLEDYIVSGSDNLYERVVLDVPVSRKQTTAAWVYVAGQRALKLIRAGRMPRVHTGVWRSR